MRPAMLGGAPGGAWCGGRAVEGTRLEIVQAREGLVGSNPTRTVGLSWVGLVVMGPNCHGMSWACIGLKHFCVYHGLGVSER